MIIKVLFAKPIDRDIKGVIKVGQDDDSNVRQELEEYVVTGELQRHFRDFFAAYVRSFKEKTDKMGVWISGFFGSGKSHFLKILSYLLGNIEVDGKKAIDYFIEDEKIKDPIVLGNMKLAGQVPTDVILFNVDSKSEMTGKQSKDAIVSVFLRVFNEMQGFCGSMPYLADLERKLTADGHYDEFKSKIESSVGQPWEEIRNDFFYNQDAIVDVFVEMGFMSEEAARNWCEKASGDYNISIEDFAKMVKRYIDQKGHDHHVVFLVDEIGQYIGDDTQLMLNLQTVTEDLGRICNGKAWVIVTSQQDIDSITKTKGNDFSKIQGRFDTRLSLSSANVDEVIRERILKKTETGNQTLSILYDNKETILKNLILFNDGVEKKLYAGRSDFAAVYPFIPYQFNLLGDVLTSIRLHGASGKHLSEGERSMLALFKESAERVMNDEPGRLVPFHVSELNWELLHQFTAEIDDLVQISMDSVGADETLAQVRALVEQAQVMAKKYHAVTTNPPYMGAAGMGSRLLQYVKDYFPDSKSDLFAVFMERCMTMTIPNGYRAMITQHAWMFLASYEKLRHSIGQLAIINMVHLGARAFEEIAGEVVQTTSFIQINKQLRGYQGTYVRAVSPMTQAAKEHMFLSGENRFFAQQEEFTKIPGSPVAYWISATLRSCFANGTMLGQLADSKQGLATSDNNRFCRLWFEPALASINFHATSTDSARKSNAKWFPYNKGGEFRRWYGNNDYVVNWENDGFEIKHSFDEKGKLRSRPQNTQFYFHESASWSLISTGVAAFRYKPYGHIFDVGGMSFFSKDLLFYLLGLCNSPVSIEVLRIIAPTINFQCGDIASIPVLISNNYKGKIEELVKENIDICRTDWDSFEFSWDFKKHPLIRNTRSLQEAFNMWQIECKNRFNHLKTNEEELNQLFIEIYGLQHELSSSVEDKNVSIRLANIERDVKGLVSYAVGCIFGRYSLDVDGLAYAGGNWNSDKYNTFIPDADNCIPITDEPYFEDDIVGRFVQFIRVCYGSEMLEENLAFIANALGNKGTSSRESIRNYFLNDFFKEHCTTYSVTGSGKRPIYWLFDSGKQNGFKALVYMHRWNADTVGNLRVEYLHRMQRVYEKEIERMQDIIDNSRDNREVNQASKRREKLVKQLKEARDYDAKIAHVALSRVEIDLDDGVKVNYEKVQKGPDGKSLGILAKI